MSYPSKGEADYLALGDWNAVCYECGKKQKASQMRKHWQGYYVCPSCYEPRQPQDFVRGVPDVQAPPWVQPGPEATFALYCTPNGRTAITDFAVADCAICDFVDITFDVNGD